MAPSSGHLLVPKALRLFQFGLARAGTILRQNIAKAKQFTRVPVPAYARAAQPIHPIALLKQSRVHQQTRSFGSRASYAKTSTVRNSIQRKGLAPFASALRPNLTGGALPRSAGGYSLGGAGKRCFSQTSATQAQVAQNVHASIRAFFLSGKRAQYDGTDGKTGEKRFRNVSAVQEQVTRKTEQSSFHKRGTTVEFRLIPLMTAITSHTEASLQQAGLIQNLSSDFARGFKDLCATFNDIDRLSTLGDLPVTMQNTLTGPVLSVRFPGCDADIVGRLCDEVGVTRGVIVEDEGWRDDRDAQMALLFPFAPGEEDSLSAETFFDRPPQTSNMKAFVPDDPLWTAERQSQSDSALSDISSFEQEQHDTVVYSPQTLPRASDDETETESLGGSIPWTHSPVSHVHSRNTSSDFEGVEGIYRFIQLCDDSRR